MEHISVFDIFKIGIGPSSSHTVGPMRAARRFAERLRDDRQLERVARVKVELFGSLGFTGKGHGSDVAVMLGLEGEDPKTVEVDAVPTRVQAGRVRLMVTPVREGWETKVQARWRATKSTTSVSRLP